MSSSAGRVLIIPKGEYNNATQYQMLDAVRYNGSLYIAKKTTIGNVPADGEYWMLCAVGATDIHWGDITGSIANQSDLINALDAKQNVLTFDSTPTASSNNPVTSAGIKTALDTKQNTLTFDTTPTSGSTNPVTSDGIHTAVQATASNLATIESSTTASQAYSTGDYLVLNGQLYEVIADIASGETLVVGTNISARTVGEELTALNNGLTSKDWQYVGLISSTSGSVALPTGWKEIGVGMTLKHSAGGYGFYTMPKLAIELASASKLVFGGYNFGCVLAYNSTAQTLRYDNYYSTTVDLYFRVYVRM